MLASSRILLVDDTPENLDVLSAILEDLECQLIVATNGERAIELAQKQHPDLILLDVMMPGMNGFEVCNLLKANPATAQIPIIFVTARTDDISVGFSVGGMTIFPSRLMPMKSAPVFVTNWNAEPCSMNCKP